MVTLLRKSAKQEKRKSFAQKMGLATQGWLTHRARLFLLFLGILLISWLAGIPHVQAQTPSILRLTDVDVADYPLVRLQAFIADNRFSPISELSALTVTQNGVPIPSFDVGRVPVGIETIFVIDGNRRLLQTDIGRELTRREVVRNSIVRYATSFMGTDQLDRVHIIAPDSAGDVSFLVEDSAFREEVIAGINEYEPTTLPARSPLAKLLEIALTKATAGYEAGRFQAIIIFTDGADINEQIFSPDIVASANALSMPIYAAILGNNASADEIVNVRRLYEPTNGFYVHMPEPTDTDPLYTALQANATQAQISYRSDIGTSGTINVGLSLEGLADSGAYTIDLQPPTVEIITQNSTPILREGTAFDTPVGELLPAQMSLTATVRWQDGYPRQLSSVSLLMNGSPVTPLNVPELDVTDLIQFDWAIGGLNAGNYPLTVQIEDELGFVVQSAEKTFQIELFRPEPVPTAVPTPAPTPAPALLDKAINTPQPSWLPWLGGLFLVAGVGWWLLRRRRLQQEEAFMAAFLRGTENAGNPEESEPIILAYLETITPTSGRKRYPLKQPATIIGRDEALVDILLFYPSVSRLHARIQQIDTQYWLYDEGSATGTYLNFERLGLTPQLLSPDDTIHVGQIQLIFRLAAT